MYDDLFGRNGTGFDAPVCSLYSERAVHRPVVTYRKCVGLDGAEDLDDATVVEPRLVVDETAKLRRQRCDGSQCVIASVEPVVMDAAKSTVRTHRRDRRKGHHARKPLSQFVLSAHRAQNVPESAKARTLIRRCDRVSLAENSIEQVALRAVPLGDPFADRAVERPEVLLHLSEVCEQFAGERRELLETFGDRAVIEQAEVTAFDALDLEVEFVAPMTKIGETDLGVRIRADIELAEEFDRSQQARLRADERRFRQRCEPGDRPLSARRDRHVRFVVTERVKTANKSPLIRCPLDEVVLRGLRAVTRVAIPLRVQQVIDHLNCVVFGEQTRVVRHERTMQKRDGERRALVAQQTPRGMPGSQVIESRWVEVHDAVEYRRRV